MKRKDSWWILEGRSYFLQLGARDYEYQDTAKATLDLEQYKVSR